MATDTPQARRRAAAGLATQAEYARHRGVSEAYISKIKDKGLLVMRGKLVDVVASDQVLDDRPVDVEQPSTAPPQSVAPQPPPTPSAPLPGAGEKNTSGTSYANAKTIDMVCRARLRKLELDRAEGRMLEAEPVRKMIADAARIMRDGILGIPDRMAPILAAETDPRKVHDILKTELSRELDAIANAIEGI